MRSVNKSAFAAGLAVLAAAARPREIGPKEWPLERIISNLEAELMKAPSDPALNYSLGRAHGFAFALETPTLSVQGTWVRDIQEQRRDPKKPRLSDSELLDHLASGVKHLSLACEEPQLHWRGRYELTLAWLLERGAHLASRVDTAKLFYLDPLDATDVDLAAVQEGLACYERKRESFEKLLGPPLFDKAVRECARRRVSSDWAEQAAIDVLLQRFWTEAAIGHYRGACEASIAAMAFTWFDRAVVEEALEAYVRLVLERGFRDAAEQSYAEDLQKRAKEQLAHPIEAAPISPILMGLDDCKSLDELIAPDLAVPFDLDGDAIDELWPWVAPGTGWLVWDPEHRGEITSGQQLFGSASAWLFFEDGYRVLDALDDDRDGELCGTELAGISLWFDRDTDGVSDRGEVVPVEELGIVALSTQATMRVGASPANLCGVEMSDGRVLPTYDWVLAPVGVP